MVAVEDGRCVGEVQPGRGQVVPGQGQHGVDVGADDRGLRGHRVHQAQLAKLPLQPLPGLVAQRTGADLLLQLRQLVAELVLLAQLLLDRLHLLVEVVLLLAALHLLAHAGPDLPLDLEDMGLPLQELEHLLQADVRPALREQGLALRQLDAELGGDAVGQGARRFDRPHGGHGLRGDVPVEFRVGGEGGVHRPHDGLDRGLVVRGVLHRVGLGPEDIARLDHPPDRRPLDALHHQAPGTVGKAEHLDDAPQRAVLVEVPGTGIGDVGVALGHQQEVPVRGLRLGQRRQGALPPDDQRNPHLGEDHQVAQGKDGQAVSPGSTDPAQGRPPALTRPTRSPPRRRASGPFRPSRPPPRSRTPSRSPWRGSRT